MNDSNLKQAIIDSVKLSDSRNDLIKIKRLFIRKLGSKIGVEESEKWLNDMHIPYHIDDFLSPVERMKKLEQVADEWLKKVKDK